MVYADLIIYYLPTICPTGLNTCLEPQPVGQHGLSMLSRHITEISKIAAWAERLTLDTRGPGKGKKKKSESCFLFA
jgi:hypothetical protein